MHDSNEEDEEVGNDKDDGEDDGEVEVKEGGEGNLLKCSEIFASF